MAQQHVTIRPGEMHETIETTALRGHPNAAPESSSPSSSAATATRSGKVCCACGKAVDGQKRFKDAQGRYWCYECGMEDHVRKHPDEGVACAKCGGKFAPTKLFEFEQAAYCEPCLAKAKASKKREQMRIAAAAEEARRQEQRRKLFAIGAGAAVLVACGVAAWQLLS